MALSIAGRPKNVSLKKAKSTAQADFIWDYERGFIIFPGNESCLPGHIFNAKQLAKDLGAAIAECWNGTEGRSFRPLARAIHLLDSTPFSVPHMPAVAGLTPHIIESPLPPLKLI